LKKLILRNNTINRQHLSLPIWAKTYYNFNCNDENYISYFSN